MTEILLIGDSFGVERVHSGVVDVPLSMTWPQLVKEHFQNVHNITMKSDFEAFRLLYDILGALDKRLEINPFQLVIVQAGLVDCFPRPLPKKLFRSRHLIFRLLRKIISYIRPFWLRYVYCHPMIEEEMIVERFIKLTTKFPDINFIYINVTPQIHKQALNTPNQSKIIDKYNDAIKYASEPCNNLEVFSLNDVCCNDDLNPLDSHLSLNGNKSLAKIVINIINDFLKI